MVNKEYGSDFHYFYPSAITKDLFWAHNRISLFFSGRVALLNLLAFGIDKYGWNKVGFPSYYCHEVVDFCKHLPIEVAYYNYNPTADDSRVNWEDKKDSVFINVDFFGIKKLDTSFLKLSVVIDDITHNLLSVYQNSADYCFGSLRKQIPTPVGGFCYARRGDFRPSTSESMFANQVALRKLSAMFLKSEYLKGAFPYKKIFRELYIDAEEQFNSLDTDSILPEIIYAQLRTFPTKELIEKTWENILKVRYRLRVNSNIKLLNENAPSAMGLVFLVDSLVLRDRLRSYLIEKKIYPAVLWPHQFVHEDIDLENRILFVHADFRYDEEDTDYITRTINKFIADV